jgi:hypothetical protein
MQKVSIRAILATVIALVAAVAGGVASAAAGTLKVTSFPTGAQVIVDGVNTGKLTPMNISLADGDHVVTVRIPGSGWNADTRTVTIAAGNNDLSVTLLPMLTVGPAGPKGDKGDKGDPGAPGANGLNGANGTSVVFVDYFSGNQYGCANGGAIYAAGSPPVQTYVCNGSNGAAATGASRADAPCFDNVNRYVDCGNGTVTDTVTGLIWLKHTGCSNLYQVIGDGWAHANSVTAGLKDGDCGLTDGSSPGDWRLPTKDEWNATIARAVALGCRFDVNQIPGPVFSLTNDAGTACWGIEGTSSLQPPAGEAWSSTTVETSPGAAWAARLIDGTFRTPGKVLNRNIWPVRGGSR